MNAILLAVLLLLGACRAINMGRPGEPTPIFFPPRSGDPVKNCHGWAGWFCQYPPADFSQYRYLEPEGASPCAQWAIDSRCNGFAAKWCGFYLKAVCQQLGGDQRSCIALNESQCG